MPERTKSPDRLHHSLRTAFVVRSDTPGLSEWMTNGFQTLACVNSMFLSVLEEYGVLEYRFVPRRLQGLPALIFFAVIFDSHIQRIVLATEETTSTQPVSHRPIKCQSRSRSQIKTKVNGSHHGDSPLLKPAGIQIATKPLPGPTSREHRKLTGVKTMSLDTKYSFYCLDCCQYFRI